MPDDRTLGGDVWQSSRMDDRLYRSRTDRMLTGVAGGLAERLDVDSALVRVVWAVSIPLTGFLTLLIYIVMAVVVPDEADGPAWAMPPPPAAAAPTPGAAAGQPPGPDGTTAARAAAGSASTGPAGAAASADEQPAAWSQDWRAQRAAARAQRRAERRQSAGPRHHGGGAIALGIILVVLGGLFLIHELVPALDWDLTWPIAAICLGVLLIAAEWRRG